MDGTEFTLAGLTLPVRILPSHPWSDEDIMQFCAKNEGLPVERDEEGYLLIMTPSGARTSNKNVYLSRMLDLWTEEDGRGLAFDSNAGFSLADGSMRSPDAAWVALDCWNALSPEDQARYSPLCPQFIVELRSPSDALRPLHRKMHKWIRNGAELAWLIDPIEKTVTIYRSGATPERLENPTEVTGEGPVAGFALPLARIFS